MSETYNFSEVVERHVDAGRADKPAFVGARRDADLRAAAPAGQPDGPPAARARRRPRAPRAARPRRHDRLPDRVPRRDADRRRAGAGERARQGRQLPPLHPGLLRDGRADRRADAAAAARGAGRRGAALRRARRRGRRRRRARRGARRAGGRVRAGADAPRRHGVLALQLGLDRQAEGRRAPPARHRVHVRHLRAPGARAARGRRQPLDHQALPRLRARQRADVPAVVRRHLGAAGRPAEARLDPARRCASAGRPCSSRCRRSTRCSSATSRPTARSTPCACASRPPRRCRRRPPSASRSASAWTSSTASARPRCCTSTARTGPGGWSRARAGAPVPGYELRIVDEIGHVLEGPAVGGLEVRGDSCAAFYWHQHEKTKACMRGDWFASGDRFERREDGAYVYVGRMDDMLKVGGLWVSPIDMENVLFEHPRVRGRRRHRDHDRGRQPRRRLRRVRGRAATTRSPTSCAPGARTGCAATSTRTSSSSSTSCRARSPARCSASACASSRRSAVSRCSASRPR